MHTIRRAKQKDVNKLKELNNKAFADNIKYDPDAVENWANSPQGGKYFENAIKRNNGCIFIYEDNGELIGYADGIDMECDWRKSKYFELINVGVDPNRQKEGVGKALMEHIIKWAKEMGFDRIYLNCYIKNTNAIDFYKHLGFEEIDICLEKDI